MAMGQNPNRTLSEHPNPTTKIGPMGGEFTYQPKWDPKTVLTTRALFFGLQFVLGSLIHLNIASAMVVSLYFGVEQATCFQWLQNVSFKEPCCGPRLSGHPPALAPSGRSSAIAEGSTPGSTSSSAKGRWSRRVLIQPSTGPQPTRSLPGGSGCGVVTLWL